MSSPTIQHATECLDDNALGAYLGGHMDHAAAERVRGHLDTCEPCQRLAAEIARGFMEPETEERTLLSPGMALDSAVRAIADLAGARSKRLAPGSRLGRYVVGEALGEGGMGVVYAARDPELARAVALKVVIHAEQDSSIQQKRLLREARTAARLQHPNVVTIFDVGQVAEATYLAMELVPGHSLRRAIGDPSLPLARRARWLMDVARALGAAHARGLMHRDIKPENVMVHEDGTIKVVDFGIARALDLHPGESLEAAVGSTVTAEGAVIGTPMYMAPEQLKSERLDERCDQFAWGVLAYELLSGGRPWTGHGVTLVSQILTVDPPPLRGCGFAAMPPDLEATLRRAMAKAPADRFPSMAAIVAALTPLAARDEPDVDASAGATPGPRRASTRTFAVVGLAALSMTAIAFALVVGRARPPAEQPSGPSMAPATRALPAATAKDVPPPAPTLPVIDVSSLPVAPATVPTSWHRPSPALAPSADPAPMASTMAVPSSAGKTTSSVPTTSGRPPGCDPPFVWRAGVKVPKPDCPLD
jgi:serine/threonine protein kinase